MLSVDVDLDPECGRHWPGKLLSLERSLLCAHDRANPQSESVHGYPYTKCPCVKPASQCCPPSHAPQLWHQHQPTVTMYYRPLMPTNHASPHQHQHQHRHNETSKLRIIMLTCVQRGDAGTCGGIGSGQAGTHACMYVNVCKCK